MHTPGPWTAMVTDTVNNEPALWDIVQRSSGGTVAEIQSHNAADAALMAAAPDLLAEAQRLLMTLQGMAIHPSHYAGLAGAVRRAVSA